MTEEDRSTMINNFSKGALFLFSSYGIVKVIGLAIQIIVLNFFPTSESDLFYKVNAFANIITPFASLGLGVAAIKFIPAFVVKKDYKKLKSQIFTSVIAMIAMSLLIFILLNLSSDIIYEKYGKEVVEMIPVIWLMSLGYLLMSYLSAVANAFKRFKVISATSVIFQGGRLLGIITLVLLGILSAQYIFGTIIASYFTVVIILAISIYQRVAKIKEKTRLDITGVIENMQFGLPIYVSSIIDSMVTYIDLALIAFFFAGNLGVVSGYGAIVMFVRNIGPIIAGPMSSVQQPYLVEENEKKNNAFNKITREVSRWISYIGIPILVIFIVFSEAILRIVASKYIEYSYLMWLFVPMVIGTLISASYRNGLFAKGYVKTLFIVSLVAISINFGLDWLLIPTIGVAGAAIGSSIASIIAESIIIIVSRIKYNARMHPDIIKAFVAGTIAVGIGFLRIGENQTISSFANEGIIQTIIGFSLICFVYCFALIIFKGLKSKDFKIILNFFRSNRLSFLVKYLNPIVDILVKYTG